MNMERGVPLGGYLFLSPTGKGHYDLTKRHLKYATSNFLRNVEREDVHDLGMQHSSGGGFTSLRAVKLIPKKPTKADIQIIALT